MAKIRQYRSQTSGGVSVRGPRMSSRSPMASALQTLGAGVSKLGTDIGEAVMEIEKDRQKSNAAKRMDELTRRSIQHMEDAKNEVGADGKGYQKLVQSKFEADRDSYLENAESEYERDLIKRSSQDLSLKLFQTSFDYETKVSLQNESIELEESVGDLRSKVQADSSYLDIALTSVGSTVGATRYTPTEKKKLGKAYSEVLHDDALKGDVARLQGNPDISSDMVDGFLNDLKADSNKYKVGATPTTYGAVINQLEKYRDNKRSIEQSQFASYAAKELDAAEKLARMPGVLTKEDIEAKASDKDKPKLLKRWAEVQEVNEFRQGLGEINFDQMDMVMSPSKTRERVLGFKGSLVDAERRESNFSRVYDNARKEFDNAPVNYVMARDSVARDKYTEMSRAQAVLMQPEAGADALSEAEKMTKEFYDYIGLEQRKVRPYRNPRYATSEQIGMAKQIVESAASKPEGNGHELVYEYLTRLRATSGEYFPDLMRDFRTNKTPKGLPDPAMPYAFVVAGELSQFRPYQTMARRVIKAGLKNPDTYDKKEYEAATKQAKKELEKFLQSQRGSIQYDYDYLAAEAPKVVAQTFLYQTAEPGGEELLSIGQIADKLFNDHYIYPGMGSYRIPRQARGYEFKLPNGDIGYKDLNPLDVHVGSMNEMDRVLQSSDLFEPGTDYAMRTEDIKSAYKNAVRASGTWVNWGDHGLRLMTKGNEGTLSAVYEMVDGAPRPVRRTWRELQESANMIRDF